MGVCDHNKEVCNQRVPLGVYFQKGTRERGEREEGREGGRDGEGARQAKLLIKTYSTSDPKV